MEIEQAFEQVIKSSEGCCMSSNNAKNLRFRYKQGMEVGHKTFLRLLRCQGYIITVTKDSSPEVIEKIITPQLRGDQSF